MVSKKASTSFCIPREKIKDNFMIFCTKGAPEGGRQRGNELPSRTPSIPKNIK
jgi:hypothetical protein